MILVDANLLIYAHSTSFAQHEAARYWLDARLNDGHRVGLPWESLLAFVRILSNPRIVQQPETPQHLWEQVREWLAVPTVWTPTPVDHHADILENLLPRITRSALVHDAHLAALAISHGLILKSTDSDFSRFVGLRWHNPLESD